MNMNMLKRYLSLACVLLLLVVSFAGCSGDDGNQPDPDGQESGEGEEEYVDPGVAPMEVTTIRVGALKGPTGMGMAPLMEQADLGETRNSYEFTLDTAPDVIQGKLVSGELDIAAVPTNGAAVLYERTGGGVQLLAINTLGVLHIVQGPEEDIQSIEDLAGKTIHSAGRGSTQEYVINHLLAEAGLTDSVSIEYHSDHATVATMLLEGLCDLALLPEPQVTNVVLKGEDISAALDITQEWEKLSGGVTLVMGSLAVRTEFLEQYPDAVAIFLEEYSASTAYVNDNAADAARMIGSYEIVDAEVARTAIPGCNIVCITGEEMKASAQAYLETIAGQDMTAVGGSVPDEGFYYIP